MDINKIRDLLRRRNELAGHILKLTENAVFSSNLEKIEEEAERFATLYEKREALVAELAAVHEKIGTGTYSEIKESGDGEAIALLEESEERLRKVLALDERNREIGDGLLHTAKEQIRRINRGRNASLKYSGELVDTDGFLLDNKN